MTRQTRSQIMKSIWAARSAAQRSAIASKGWTVRREHIAQAQQVKARRSQAGKKAWAGRLARVDKKILVDAFYDPWFVESEKFSADATIVDNAKAFPIGAVDIHFLLMDIRRGVVLQELTKTLRWAYADVLDFWREMRDMIRQERLDFCGEYDPQGQGLDMEFYDLRIESRP